MTLFTVTVTGVTNPVEVYGGLTGAKDYLGAAIGDGATAFAALTDDAAAGQPSKSRMLVAASRYIDRIAWLGTATATGGTTLKWPRSGVTDATGAAVDSTTVPVNIVNAVYELAAIFADDQDVQAQRDAGSNIRSLKAGSAGIDFFAPTSAALGTATKFPTVVQALIGPYLASSAAVALGVSQGTQGESSFGDDDDDDDDTLAALGRSWPL